MNMHLRGSFPDETKGDRVIKSRISLKFASRAEKKAELEEIKVEQNEL